MYPVPADTQHAMRDLDALEEMFPDLDPAVISDVYDACNSDVERTTQALSGLSEASFSGLPPDDGAGPSYYDPDGSDSYMLGSVSLSEWTTKLERLTWDDTVKALTGTFTTISTNVVQGINTLAESIGSLVQEIGGTRSEQSSSQGGPPQPQGMLLLDGETYASGSSADSHLLHRRHDRHTGSGALAHAASTDPEIDECASSPKYAKKDD